jgi:hypothetical protein
MQCHSTFVPRGAAIHHTPCGLAVDVVLLLAQHRPELVEGRLKGIRGGRVVRQAHHGGSAHKRLDLQQK